MIGTGGLSHQLDGERAGFINKDFDLQFMESMTSDPSWATKYTTHELVELAGTQGVELLNWLVARGTLPEKVRRAHSQLPHPDLEHGLGADGARAAGLSFEGRARARQAGSIRLRSLTPVRRRRRHKAEQIVYRIGMSTSWPGRPRRS